jgi:hypothetical protein
VSRSGVFEDVVTGASLKTRPEIGRCESGETLQNQNQYLLA